jgi:hypothetical protein
MRRTLRAGLAASLFVSASLAAHAQNDRFAYAITDVSKEGSNWSALRKVDLATGEYTSVLFNGTDMATPVLDAGTKKLLVQQPDARFGNLLQAPFSTGVAAAAYDRKNNRLYYTPMFIDQLRYIDLKTMKVYYVTESAFSGLGNMHNDEAKCITRMVITPDGDGYAITNDANTVIKFSTGKNIKVQQLGGLVDDPSNGGISIHNRCSSWGGDMIADDRGNLFILTARNHVFQVSTDTKVAKHLGAIEGLPANFTVNGAAVDGDGNLLVSSAMYGQGNYVVNPKSWAASSTGTASSFHSSDLANSNFLSTRPKVTTIETLVKAPSTLSSAIQVYPNPVTGNQFTLQFGKVPAGDYTLQLTDVMGKVILQKRIAVGTELQTEVVSLKATNAKGVYLVKVVDNAQKNVFEQKIIVQ